MSASFFFLNTGVNINFQVKESDEQRFCIAADDFFNIYQFIQFLFLMLLTMYIIFCRW